MSPLTIPQLGGSGSVGPQGPQGPPGPSNAPLVTVALPSTPADGDLVAFYAAEDDAALNVPWLLRYNEDADNSFTGWEGIGGVLPLWNPNSAPLNIPYDSYQLIDDIGWSLNFPFPGEYSVHHSMDIENTNAAAHDFSLGIMNDYSGGLVGTVTETFVTIPANTKVTVTGLAYVQVDTGHGGSQHGPVVNSIDDVVATCGNYRALVFPHRIQPD